MQKRSAVRWFLIALVALGPLFWGVPSIIAGELFNGLVETAKSEMEKKGGKLHVALEWTTKETKGMLEAFQKDFPFLKEFKASRERRVENMQRVLLEVKQGRIPEYDIMHVSSESWPDYTKEGLFVKPPFDYKKLVKDLPADWGEVEPRSVDPEGTFIATTGLARGNAWNPNLVPKGKEPRTWEACLDPMWKGKFLYDPRPKLTGLWWDRKTREMHIKWLKGIVENKVVLNRGQTENLQKVAGGEFPLVCGVNYHSVFRAVDKGAPLEFAFPDPFAMDLGTQIHVVKWSKTPATTQLLVLWLATKGQDAVDKNGYRGFPWNPRTRKYSEAKGKYVAICDAECINSEGAYIKLHAEILGLPGVR